MTGVAHYGVSPPALPRAWDEWRFWQYSAPGRVPGVRNPTDLHQRYDSDKDLLAYLDGEPIDAKPPAADLQAGVTCALAGVWTASTLTLAERGPR